MLIEIKPDIFNGSISFQEIASLFYPLITKGRYDVFIDIENLKQYDIFSGFNDDDLFIMREAYTLQIQNNEKISYSIGNSKNERTFNLKEAKYFFWNLS